MDGLISGSVYTIGYYEEMLQYDLDHPDSINIAYDSKSIGLLWIEIGNDQKALVCLE